MLSAILAVAVLMFADEVAEELGYADYPKTVIAVGLTVIIILSGLKVI